MAPRRRSAVSARANSRPPCAVSPSLCVRPPPPPGPSDRPSRAPHRHRLPSLAGPRRQGRRCRSRGPSPAPVPVAPSAAPDTAPRPGVALVPGQGPLLPRRPCSRRRRPGRARRRRQPARTASCGAYPPGSATVRGRSSRQRDAQPRTGSRPAALGSGPRRRPRAPAQTPCGQTPAVPARLAAGPTAAPARSHRVSQRRRGCMASPT